MERDNTKALLVGFVGLDLVRLTRERGTDVTLKTRHERTPFVMRSSVNFNENRLIFTLP